MNMKSIEARHSQVEARLSQVEARLSQVEARHSRGESDWERRQRECAEYTRRQTVERYGHINEAEHQGEPYTDECRDELLRWADEYDALPVKPMLEEILKEYGEIMQRIEA